jgi:homoserine dehydrogenase
MRAVAFAAWVMIGAVARAAAARGTCNIAHTPPYEMHLIGIGGVGRTLAHQLLGLQQRSEACAAQIQLHSISDSSGAIVGSDATSELDAELVRRIVAYKERDPTSRLSAFNLDDDGGASHTPAADVQAMRMLYSGGRHADNADGGRRILVDCSASGSPEHLARLRAARGALVFANKKPLADAGYAAFAALHGAAGSGRALRYEATVGAGLPIISTLQRQQLVGDNVTTITAMLSGTLGVVFDQLQPTSGAAAPRFSDVVREALRNGYTEPDPRDDLSGTDVARKALILARSAALPSGSGGGGGGGGIEVLTLEGVGADPLFPDAMASMSLGEFMGEGLPQLDAPMAARAAEAAARGEVLRYLATVTLDRDTGALVGVKAGIESVARTTPFGALRGTDNLVAFGSDMYATAPLVVQGAGAGREVTAAGVLGDIVELVGCH